VFEAANSHGLRTILIKEQAERVAMNRAQPHEMTIVEEHTSLEIRRVHDKTHIFAAEDKKTERQIWMGA
jgi:hypothetical protein